MRPYGTSEQLSKRRGRALELLAQGQSPRHVAQQVGSTDRSVRRWRAEAQQPVRKKNPRPPGRQRRLSAAQLQRLERVLKRGAFASGYAEEYWTLDRIAHVIWELFAVRYHPSGVWHLLRAIGWSCQKPQRRPFERDEAAVAHWKRYGWSMIKKVA
jgi:transposase